MLSEKHRQSAYKRLKSDCKTDDEIGDILNNHWTACTEEIVLYKYGADVGPGTLFDTMSFMTWCNVIEQSEIAIAVPAYNMYKVLAMDEFMKINKLPRLRNDITNMFRFDNDNNLTPEFSLGAGRKFLRFDHGINAEVKSLLSIAWISPMKYIGLKRGLVKPWNKINMTSTDFGHAIYYPGGDVPVIGVDRAADLMPLTEIKILNSEIVDGDYQPQVVLDLISWLENKKIFPRHPQYNELAEIDDSKISCVLTIGEYPDHSLRFIDAQPYNLEF